MLYRIPNFRYSRIVIFAWIMLCATGLTACATQPVSAALEPPEFLAGLLHGFTILFSFIGSIFADYRIYAFLNSGGWYDLGYFTGALMFLGGSGASAR